MLDKIIDLPAYCYDYTCGTYHRWQNISWDSASRVPFDLVIGVLSAPFSLGYWIHCHVPMLSFRSVSYPVGALEDGQMRLSLVGASESAKSVVRSIQCREFPLQVERITNLQDILVILDALVTYPCIWDKDRRQVAQGLLTKVVVGDVTTSAQLNILIESSYAFLDTVALLEELWLGRASLWQQWYVESNTRVTSFSRWSALRYAFLQNQGVAPKDVSFFDPSNNTHRQ